jgi:DNA polymerase-4
VIVGGPSKRGVVAASSYEARAFGVYSAMPMVEALRRCPQAIVVRHHMGRYADASRAFFAILDDFSPLVEPLSLDEAFLDVTGADRLLGDGPTIGRAIKQRVRDELQLVASVGVAPIKFAAKIASDIDKPDGLRVVSPGELLPFLHALPIGRLWGAGAVTQEKLAALGLQSIGDVARYPESVLVARLGEVTGRHLAALARGEDERGVEPESAPVSVGHEETFDIDLYDRADVAVVMLSQADRVAARLRHAELRARTVMIKVKYTDFQLISRRRTLDDPTSDGAVIGRAAVALLADVELHARRRIRHCGVSATNLEQRNAPRQLRLDEATRARGERLGDTLDRITGKFGGAAIARAIHVGGDDEDEPPAPSGPPSPSPRSSRR